MSKNLWAHQKLAIKRYVQEKSFGLLFDCGLGKTLTATRIAEEKNKPVLIIAPNALCKQWEEELTNKNDETRITTKDWEVLLCTSKTKKTKRFKEKLDSFREL